MKLSIILENQEYEEGLTENMKLLKLLFQCTTDGHTWRELTNIKFISPYPYNKRYYANEKLLKLSKLLKEN